MKAETRHLIADIISLICGLWFLALGWFWVYLFNVIVVFPVAVIGFIVWLLNRKSTRQTLHKIVGWIYLAGVITSLSFLLYVWLVP